MYVYLRQQWIDKRLAHGTEATLTLGGTDVERIWLPDTYITNANDYEVFTSNQLVLIDNKGQIFYFAYVRIAGACQMDLVKFPMDVQRCHLTLESCKYSATCKYLQRFYALNCLIRLFLMKMICSSRKFQDYFCTSDIC